MGSLCWTQNQVTQTEIHVCRYNPQLKLVLSECILSHITTSQLGGHVTVSWTSSTTYCYFELPWNIFHPSHVKQNTTLPKLIKMKTKFSFYRQTTNRSSWIVCYNTFTSRSKIYLQIRTQRSMHCKAVANTQVKYNPATQTEILLLHLPSFQDKNTHLN